MAKQTNNTDNLAAENQAIKKRGRGGKYNFPNAVDPDSESKEDIRAVLIDTMRWYDRGEDRPTTDDEIYDRSREYFQTCIDEGIRPTVEAYCLALGYGRTTVHEWKTGKACSPRRTNIIKMAFEAFATFDAGMAAKNKMNPVLYFFRAKNYYGMRDQQELVIEPKSQLASDIDAETIATRYAELPSD